MKLPKKIYFPVLIFLSFTVLISIVLILIFGFDEVEKYSGFISNVIAIPVSIYSLIGILRILDEEKLINMTLIEAGKKDQEEWEKNKERMAMK